MSTLDVSKLKVTELRAELSKRNLPTKGKKDELVARLKEAIEAESPEENQPEESTEVTEEKKSEETDVQPMEEDKPAEQQSKDEQKEDSNTKSEKLEDKDQEKSDDHKVEEKTEEAPVKETAKEAVKEPVKEPVKEIVEEPVKEIVEETAKEIVKETAKEIAKEVVKEVVKETVEKTTEEPAKEPVKEEVGNKRKRSVERAEDEKRPKTESGISSSALYVKGFVRPLILRNAQEFFSAYGPLKRFWMDSIKTHAYVIYENVADAQMAYSKTNGIHYPADSNKTLSVGGITPEEAEKLIVYEQNAAESRIKVDWEAAIQKVKSGEELPVSEGGGIRKPRSLGIGQVARQLQAQATTTTTTTTTTPAATVVAREEKRPLQERKELSLEDLFRKTQALPHLYYLPNTDQEAKIKLEKLQNK